MSEIWRTEKAPGNLKGAERTALRRLFMLLSPRSLPYARLALKSLYANCAEGFSIVLVTDGRNDVLRLQEELETLTVEGTQPKRLSVAYGETDLSDLEEDKLGKFEHIRHFRHGHPCWRKITDPILLSNDGDEMIVLDPDLYFPNRFCFEETVESGVMLMWQSPSCLLPAEVVEAAMSEAIPLAHHTDIGIAQWRAPIDLEWLNWLIHKLGSPQLPRHMHVESIVWAALAMKMGGGHLDPKKWVCWHRTQYKRLLIKLGVPGRSILERETFSGIKCFHAGGEAKWWLADAQRLGRLDRNEDVTHNSALQPYVGLTPAQYRLLQFRRLWLRRVGYYRALG